MPRRSPNVIFRILKLSGYKLSVEQSQPLKEASGWGGWTSESCFHTIPNDPFDPIAFFEYELPIQPELTMSEVGLWIRLMREKLFGYKAFDIQYLPDHRMMITIDCRKLKDKQRSCILHVIRYLDEGPVCVKEFYRRIYLSDNKDSWLNAMMQSHYTTHGVNTQFAVWGHAFCYYTKYPNPLTVIQFRRNFKKKDSVTDMFQSS